MPHNITPDGKAGQRCPVGGLDCYSVLVASRVMLCPIGQYKDYMMAVLAPANE